MIPGPPAPRHQLETTTWCQAHTLQQRAYNKGGGVHTLVRARASTRPHSVHGWTSITTDQKRDPSFRCRVHRLDYTDAFQCVLQEIKLNTHDYSGLWNTLDRDQCAPFIYLFFPPRLTANDKDSKEEPKRRTHILEVIKCRSDFAENEMWRFTATQKTLLRVLWSYQFFNKNQTLGPFSVMVPSFFCHVGSNYHLVTSGRS